MPSFSNSRCDRSDKPVPRATSAAVKRLWRYHLRGVFEFHVAQGGETDALASMVIDGVASVIFTRTYPALGRNQFRSKPRLASARSLMSPTLTITAVVVRRAFG